MFASSISVPVSPCSGVALDVISEHSVYIHESLTDVLKDNSKQTELPLC